MLASLFSFLKDVIFFVGYVNSGNSFPEPLSPAMEQLYLKRLETGDEEARAKLIEHNLRLVAHIAKKYVNNGRDSDDVISIGTIGLIKAVSTYNPNKGSALATYAARCIENEILMSLRTEKRQANEMSINESIGTDRDGNDIALVEVLGSEMDLVSSEVELRIAAEQLKRLMQEVLTPREHTVVELRYGLVNGKCMAQREIAELLDISRSYVSRIEKKALNKLHQAFLEHTPTLPI